MKCNNTSASTRCKSHNVSVQKFDFGPHYMNAWKMRNNTRWQFAWLAWTGTRMRLKNAALSCLTNMTWSER